MIIIYYLWRGASKYSLATLDRIQKRAIRIIDDSALTDSLDSLAHRRIVSALSLYYRYYHGKCSDELKSVIPLLKACSARSTRFADSKHSFVIKLENCGTTSFANTLVPMTSRNWNSFQAVIIFWMMGENFLTKGIENFISQKRRGFFDRFFIPLDFLQKDPLEWEDDTSFQIGLEIIKKNLKL